jgi:hypothetical protein
MHAAQEILEARVGPQRIELQLAVDEPERRGVLVVPPVQPEKRRVLVAERGFHLRNRVSHLIAGLRPVDQIAQHGLGLATAAGQRVGHGVPVGLTPRAAADGLSFVETAQGFVVLTERARFSVILAIKTHQNRHMSCQSVW